MRPSPRRQERVLTWGGEVARTYYHSTSGGRTAAAVDVFGFDIPYLRSHVDPFDDASPHHVRNRVVVTPRLLAAKLKQPALAHAADVTCEVDGSGRPTAVLVRLETGVRRSTPTASRTRSASRGSGSRSASCRSSGRSGRPPAAP